MKEHPNQLTLDHLLFTYHEVGEHHSLTNEELYAAVAQRAGIDKKELDRREAIGADGRKYSKKKRTIRWIQQSLKQAGLLERSGRAEWKLTREGREKVELRKIISGFSMLAFSTKYGIAIWGDAKDVFASLDQPITLMISSPPYPIAYGRGYGSWSETEIVDFIISIIEPIVKNLKDGGSIMLNLGNDVFERGRASRSIYIERLILKMYDDLGLHKMDTIIWHNPSKAPGPIEWASKRKIQMATSYEPIVWMCNNPNKALTNNQRILQPLSEQYQKLIEKGGEQKTRKNSDGAHIIRKGSFSNRVNGSMPRNVYQRGHRSESTNFYKKRCEAMGIPSHGAMFPMELAEHFIKFASEENDLVVDPFGGALSVGIACEKNKRRFITTDIIHEYLHGGSMRFDEALMNPEFLDVLG